MHDASLVKIGRSACAAIRGGVPTGDLVDTLFRSSASPTLAQALVAAATTILDPSLEFAPGGRRFTEGVTVGDVLDRVRGNFLAGFRGGPL